jgi:leucyl aminopeptidase (aminopeptidase T)
MHDRLKESAARALADCLGLAAHERLLVVTDPPCESVGRAFWDAGRERCREAALVYISPRKENGNEPPAPVGEWFSQFDVAVMPTSKSLSHTDARRRACAAGVRIATLPGVTDDMFLRTMGTDWKMLRERTQRFAGALSAARTIRIVTGAGTDLRFETGGRPAKPDDGKIDSAGAFGNLPAGEAYLAPLEETAEGTLVVDGSFPLAGLLVEPLILHVSKGRVRDATGHACAGELKQLFARYDENCRTIAEFGVGTLDTATISGNTLEDEKAAGTIHIAVGDNASMGGRVQAPIHLDGVVRSPTVYLDGALWMDEGAVVAGQ